MGKEARISAPARNATTTAALAAVRRLSFAALDAPDPRAIYATLAAELLGVFGVDQVHVCRVAQDETLSHGTGYTLAGEHVRSGEDYVVPFDQPSGVHHVLKTGEPLNILQATSSPLVASALVERFRAASLLYVPLAYAGSVRSVVVLLTEAPRDFKPDEVDLAYTMANQASAGLDVLELRSVLSGRAEKQAALARAARALNARLDQRSVLDTLCREADLALGGDLAGVYPDGLAAETIPIGSRIILACDAYNAMITERPYRKPMSNDDALEELRAGAGSQFDPRVVEALEALLPERRPEAALRA